VATVPGLTVPEQVTHHDSGALRAATMRGPKPDLPRYIRACRDQAWSMVLRNPKDPTAAPMVTPYRCHSWRHEGECARKVASVWYARIKQALEELSPSQVTFAVLTFNPCDWSDPAVAYQGMWRCTQSLMQAVRRRFGPTNYVGLVEQHRSTWPHLNLLLVGQGVGQAVSSGEFMPWLKRHLVDCGFGYIVFAETAKSPEAVNGYIVGLARDFEATAAEVTKLTQVPVYAPKGFRRLRSSQHFLPPKITRGLTGYLVRGRASIVSVLLDVIESAPPFVPPPRADMLPSAEGIVWWPEIDTALVDRDAEYRARGLYDVELTEARLLLHRMRQ